MLAGGSAVGSWATPHYPHLSWLMVGLRLNLGGLTLKLELPTTVDILSEGVKRRVQDGAHRVRRALLVRGAGNIHRQEYILGTSEEV